MACTREGVRGGTRSRWRVNEHGSRRVEAYFCLRQLATRLVTSRPDDRPVGRVQLFKVSCHSGRRARRNRQCVPVNHRVPQHRMVNPFCSFRSRFVSPQARVIAHRSTDIPLRHVQFLRHCRAGDFN